MTPFNHAQNGAPVERFIPVDETAADSLRQQMAGTIFQDPDTFIKHFNAGVISRSNELVREYAQLIAATFKDVVSRGNRLSFISASEVRAREALDRLGDWSMLVRLKRELSDLVEDGALTHESVISVNLDGDCFHIFRTEEGEVKETPLDSVSRLRTSETDALQKVSGVESFENKALRFRVSTILGVDDGFLNNLHVPPLP